MVKTINGSNTVLKFLLDNNKCVGDSISKAYLIRLYDENRQLQIQHWIDTVKDSLKTPIDTTLPTLGDLDLGLLRGPLEVVQENQERIGKIQAIRNPFADFLELRYRLDRGAMTRIEICDVLGKSVYSEGQGFKEEGDHTVTFSSIDWPSGSYYVRLSTPSGEVKTVKVIKE